MYYKLFFETVPLLETVNLPKIYFVRIIPKKTFLSC